MAKNNVKNVSAGKPKAGGAIFRAPIGTALPTDATTALAETYVCLGYCSEDGLVETEERETEEVKAWGGDTVLRPQTGYSKQYGFTPIETNKEVLETRYGLANVEGDEKKITVHHNADELDHFVWVFEILLSNNRVSRKVIEDGQVTEVGEISYVDGEPIGYEMTMSVFPGSDSDYVKEYIAEIEDDGGE